MRIRNKCMFPAYGTAEANVLQQLKSTLILSADDLAFMQSWVTCGSIEGMPLQGMPVQGMP